MASGPTEESLLDYVNRSAKYCEEEKLEARRNVFQTFEGILKEWVIDFGKSINVDGQILSNNGARLMAFGGQQVGLVTEDSDIDAVFVVPSFIARDIFFRSIPSVLNKYGATKMRVIEAAYVPVIKLTFQCIQFDVCFARLQMESIPEDLDLVPSEILKEMSPECIRSINGVRETLAIIEAVPNFELFIHVMKAVKYWAKTKAVYGTAMGYLGGIGWTLLVAFCCQKNQRLPFEKLLQQFFYTMANWQWPQAIMLRPLEKDVLNLKPWNPQVNTGDLHHKMPIITPVYPEHNCAFTVLASTKVLTTEYLEEACSVVDSILDGREGFGSLFQPAPFFTRHKHFLIVMSKAKSEQDHIDWAGLVEAKLRLLVTSLEKQRSITLAHPYPKTFKPVNATPDLFQSIWFIGLQFNKATGLQLDLAQDIQNFNDALSDAAHLRQFYKKGMKIEVKHVKRKQLNQYIAEEHTIY